MHWIIRTFYLVLSKIDVCDFHDFGSIRFRTVVINTFKVLAHNISQMAVQAFYLPLPVENLVVEHLLVSSIPYQLGSWGFLQFLPGSPALFSSIFVPHIFKLVQSLQSILGNQLSHVLFLLFEVYLCFFDAFITDLRHCVGDILVELFLYGHFESAGLVFVKGIVEVLV